MCAPHTHCGVRTVEPPSAGRARTDAADTEGKAWESGGWRDGDLRRGVGVVGGLLMGRRSVVEGRDVIGVMGAADAS